MENESPALFARKIVVITRQFLEEHQQENK